MTRKTLRPEDEILRPEDPVAGLIIISLAALISWLFPESISALIPEESNATWFRILAALFAFCVVWLQVALLKFRLQGRRFVWRPGAERRARWQKFVDRHRELQAKVLRLDGDLALALSYPALLDLSVPQTAELHRALRALDSVSSELPKDPNLSLRISELPYPKLVVAAEEAWREARIFAERRGTKGIPRNERRKMAEIVELLKLVRSDSTSEQERGMAQERIERLSSELRSVQVPVAALQG